MDEITITNLPDEQDVTKSLEQISEPVKTTRQPDIRVTLGQIAVWVNVIGGNQDMGPNEPYVICKTAQIEKFLS